MPDAPNHKSPKKKIELKYEKRKKKKKNCNRASGKPMDSEKNNERQAQHQTHNKPNRLQRQQRHGFSKKKKKKPQYTLQITKSEITKANLKTKMSIEQRCNTSQQMDWASQHRRLINQAPIQSTLHQDSGIKDCSLDRIEDRRSVTSLARHLLADQRSLISCPSVSSLLASVLP